MKTNCPPQPTPSRWWWKALLLLAAWAALGTLFTLQFVLLGSLDWREAMSLSWPFWVTWAPLLPIVVWLAFRFPLEQGKWSTSVPAHVLGCVAVLAVGLISVRQLGPGPAGRPGLENQRRAQEAGRWPPGRPEEAPNPERPDGPPFGRNGPPPWTRGGGRQAAFRLTSDLLLYWLIVSAATAVIYLQRARQRERQALALQARLSEARLLSLRMQLQPHFLFNTLNAISTLVYTSPRAADEMISNLSGLLRSSLDTAEEQEVPLRRELDFLKLYLDIEQVRFGDRLRFEQDIPPEAMTAFVPTLILQPIVENAIKHGIEPQTRAGLIRISARRRGEWLRLTVVDNGAGLAASDAPATAPGTSRPSSSGIGLRNTQARLSELYGPQHRFTLSNEPAGGCVVEVEWPWHTEPMPAATAPTETPS